MSEISSPSSEIAAPRSLIERSRVLITLCDQGLVSAASFATNFLLLHHFSSEQVSHYAYYTLAFNLMIWAAELQNTLVITPHTMLTPRMSGDALRRFHGSTLLQSTFVSVITMILTAVGGAFAFGRDRELSFVLFALAVGAVAIGLRNYARPYAFAARKPIVATLLDLAVAILQIGGVIALERTGTLSAYSAILVIAAASAIPSLVWFVLQRSHFRPSVRHAIQDYKVEWPNTRWVFLSGMLWNGGMQLYPWLILICSGDREVAVWGACYQLACVANPLLMGLQNFIGPRIAEAFAEMSRPAFAQHVLRTAGVVSLLMTGPAILLSFFADDALRWLTKGEFTGHQQAITLLCAMIVIQAITFTLSRGLFALNRADLDLYCNILPLLTLFTLGVWATTSRGVDGAAASMLVAQVLSASSRGVLFFWALSRPAAPAGIEHPVAVPTARGAA